MTCVKKANSTKLIQNQSDYVKVASHVVLLHLVLVKYVCITSCEILFCFRFFLSANLNDN